MKVKFEIDGEPVSKLRTRSDSRGKHHTPEKTVMYENWIKLFYRTKVKKYFEGYVKINVVAYFGITKADCKALKENKANTKAYKIARGKTDGKIRPDKKPDADNILKTIVDSLNTIAYKDDAQVVEMSISKYYSERPRVLVEIESI